MGHNTVRCSILCVLYACASCKRRSLLQAAPGPWLPVAGHQVTHCTLFHCVLHQVIIGAPTVISEDLLRTFNISLVVRGSVTETRTSNSGDSDRCAAG